jgi:hypothetical protein
MLNVQFSILNSQFSSERNLLARALSHRERVAAGRVRGSPRMRIEN